MKFNDLKTVSEIDTINQTADKIAELILSVDTDYRALLLVTIADSLKKRTNFYTARLFDEMADKYGKI